MVSQKASPHTQHVKAEGLQQQKTAMGSTPVSQGI